MVAEQHRDEFRAVAQYLNDLAELDADRGIAVWLIEARAVRIESSPWAPLFSMVVEPNAFTATVEAVKSAEGRPGSEEEFWEQFTSEESRAAAKRVLSSWIRAGHRRRLGPHHVVLEARGPSANGFRTVVALYDDGRVMVPFHSYAGTNSGIEVAALTADAFRARADELFGFSGSERLARTGPGWSTAETVGPLNEFCREVAHAYERALDESDVDPPGLHAADRRDQREAGTST